MSQRTHRGSCSGDRGRPWREWFLDIDVRLRRLLPPGPGYVREGRPRHLRPITWIFCSPRTSCSRQTRKTLWCIIGKMRHFGRRRRFGRSRSTASWPWTRHWARHWSHAGKGSCCLGSGLFIPRSIPGRRCAPGECIELIGTRRGLCFWLRCCERRALGRLRWRRKGKLLFRRSRFGWSREAVRIRGICC